MSRSRPGRGVAWAVAGLGLVAACLPNTFEALAEAAPVDTLRLRFPNEPNAEVAVALSVAADDEGRGRVLLSDGDSALGWLRVDLDGRVDTRFAEFGELVELGTHERPTLTGLAVVRGASVAEAVVRVAAREDSPQRVVRFRVADFSRVMSPELDAVVYPWLAQPELELGGALAAAQLDAGLPEILSVSSAGLVIWDEMGSRALEYAEARAAALTEDPAAFDLEPEQGWGLTLCPELMPTALAGGDLLGAGEPAALALVESEIVFVAAAETPELSLIGAPVYDCARASRSLPGPAQTLAVLDLGRDGDDDLVVGAPASRRVWVYENLGEGLPDAPTLTLVGEDDELEFGASMAAVELGEGAPEVLLVGAPGTRVGGKAGAGRVVVFELPEGQRMRTLDDLEPVTDSRHGLGVHALELPGRAEPVVSGARELRIHWRIHEDDPGSI